MKFPRFLLLFTIVFTMTFFCLTAADASTIEPVKVYLDGKQLSFDVTPRVLNGRVLVPLRVCAEELGMNISYEPATRAVKINNDNHEIDLTVDQKVSYVDGQSTTLDVAPTIINGRTMMPLRFMATSFGLAVEWRQTSQTVLMASVTSADDTALSTEELDQLAAQTAQAISQLRAEAGLTELKSVPEAGLMAQSYATELAGNFAAAIAKESSTIASRAAGQGLPVPSELTSAGLKNPENIIAAWLSSADSKNILFDPGAFFLGIAAVQNADGDVYLVAEIINSPTFFLAPPESQAVEQKITMQGYTISRSPRITLYKLAPNDDLTYTESYPLTPQVSGNNLTLEVTLPEVGRYALLGGSHIIHIEN